MEVDFLREDGLSHDASDCRRAFEAGDVTLRGVSPSGVIDFGDDASNWSHDLECDDGRFDGPGITATPLLDWDIGHDATDCRTAYEAGNLTLRGVTIN